jgi:hypothetical protein
MSSQRNNKTYPNSPLPTPKRVPLRKPMGSSELDENSVSKLVINDDLNKELLKHDINIEKWYHLLLVGQYYNKDGGVYYEDPILKRLAVEYQKAVRIKNIETMVLIKNELMNHFPEQLWIHKYFMGEVCGPDGRPLIQTKPELEIVANEYQTIYNKARQEAL